MLLALSDMMEQQFLKVVVGVRGGRDMVEARSDFECESFVGLHQRHYQWMSKIRIQALLLQG